MYFLSILALCGAFSYVTCDPVPCKLTDPSCVERIGVQAYAKFIEGDEDSENLDPMYLDIVEGNLSILKFKLLNSTVTGFKDCKMENVKLDAAAPSLHIELVCPKLLLKGKYDINGRLIILPVEGNGDYTIETGKYRISVDSELKLSPGKDGNTYMSIVNFKQNAEPLESIKFDFRNLFNGQKDLGDAVLKFANERWLEVAKESQDPVFVANLKTIMKNANKYYKTVPVEN